MDTWQQKLTFFRDSINLRSFDNFILLLLITYDNAVTVTFCTSCLLALNIFKHILDRVDKKAEEHKPFDLYIIEPAPPDKGYKKIEWRRHTKYNSTIIVLYHQYDGYDNYEITYYSDYCCIKQKCGVSEKGELNTDTGELTIYNVTNVDEAFYYYSFWVDENVPDTGKKYEQDLEVFGRWR